VWDKLTPGLRGDFDAPQSLACVVAPPRARQSGRAVTRRRRGVSRGDTSTFDAPNVRARVVVVVAPRAPRGAAIRRMVVWRRVKPNATGDPPPALRRPVCYATVG